MDRGLVLGSRLLRRDRPRIMGVINVTPDSFSDGGRYLAPDRALRQAQTLVAQGADILDVGGESTRPGAAEVPVEEELERVLPVVEALADFAIPISVDTRKAAVMRAAVAAGAAMINDVSALRHDPEALTAVAELQVPVCLMHMQGTPGTMQNDPRYEDVVTEVRAFLEERARQCLGAGVPASRILIDPGIGFGKTLEHNLALLSRLDSFADMGYPLVVGTSRKSLIGQVLNRPLGDRLYGDCAVVAWSVSHGADIVRVHDVGPMHEVATMIQALRTGGQGF